MYTYDYLNQMVSRSFDPDGAGTEPAQTTYYAYQGGQIVFQFDDPTLATTEPSHRYFWNPLAVDQLFADENTATSTVLWAITDQQGTVRDLATHDSGTGATTVVLHRDYDAWGNLTSATGSLLGDYDYAFNEQTHDIVNTIAATDELFGYTGRAFDVATGLQNNLNRWYNPKTGRFNTEDPKGLGPDSNACRYVLNQPTMLTDPTGLEPPAGGIGLSPEQVNEILQEVTRPQPLPPMTYVPGVWGDSIHLNDSYFANSFFGIPTTVCHGATGAPRRMVGPVNSFRFPAGAAQLQFYQNLRDTTAEATPFILDAGIGLATLPIRTGTLPLRLSNTVANHATDIVMHGPFRGRLARPYINSPLLMREIMNAAEPCPDAIVKGGLKWSIPGSFRGSAGTWELVLDPETNTVIHFLFK